MVGSKDLKPSTTPFFPNVFFHNQFCAKPQWPAPNTSLAGQTAIVTGANTGLGYETALQLLGLKLPTLILAVRSLGKGEAAAAKLRKLHPKADIEVWALDMSSYDSIQAFTRRLESQMARVDIAILNAGLITAAFSTVKSTGHEEAVQVNYLSTMLLAVLLLPILKTKGPPDGQPARLTIVSAALTLAAKFPNRDANPLLPSFDDPQTYDGQEHYHSSKLLAHMFLWKLVDYVSADDVIINLADPAWCKGTELVRWATGAAKVFVQMFAALTGRTPQVGASCFVDAVVNKGKESHGCFLMSWKIHPFSAFLYTPEGKVVIKRVWDETLAELDFAGVRTILGTKRA
ncbi:NAD(P)-binding protein-23 [Coleophoma cylindrospora]|uniref:NAD(P)-binding protein-23 n=1 Tax=Coleophoma cylindrospora TaxID=1849047 RepID=A0A3D8SDQ8_9HELO|nr:NAD(P)-binding protein-23 [Coleophoma cylindrospora]